MLRLLMQHFAGPVHRLDWPLFENPLLHRYDGVVRLGAPIASGNFWLESQICDRSLLK